MLVPSKKEAYNLITKLHTLNSLHWQLYLPLFIFFLQSILNQNSWRILTDDKEFPIWKKCLSKVLYF